MRRTGVDMLKVDSCGGREDAADSVDKFGRYANGSFVMNRWRDAVKATGRPILLSDCHLGCMCK